MLPACAARKGPAFKPQFRVCYLCGQQFGSASIAIHIPQCFSKKVSQWEIADPATRGKRPKHPDTVNWKGDGLSIAQQNDDQFHEFTANLVPCRNCGRKFLPDRLVVHLRSCKGPSGREATREATRAGGGGDSAPAPGGRSASQGGRRSAGHSRSPRRTSNGSTRAHGYKPQLPICYLCGQQFGNTSIGIHVPQCYAKKLSQWEVADVMTRGKPPKHPDSVNWKSTSSCTDEHNDAQFAEFVSNLEPCPNCGRKFFADRLVVHLRSCKPGSTSKPVHHSNASVANSLSSAGPASPVAAFPATEVDSRPNTSRSQVGRGSAANKTNDQSVSASAKADLARLNPKTNRIPKDGSVDVNGRLCPVCKVVEHDVSAKYCRECGANLALKSSPISCVKCGESIPMGSRFCGTCGVPVNGATASERDAGAENINASTTRVLVCPGCKAISDADGNFCDNCGAALGDVEPLGGTRSSSVPKVEEVMYCNKCGESFDDLLSKFCEECGGTLEKMHSKMLSSGGPTANTSTLSPCDVELHSSSKAKMNPHLAPSALVKKTHVSSSGEESAKERAESRLSDTNTTQFSSSKSVKFLPSPEKEKRNVSKRKPMSLPARPSALTSALDSANNLDIPEEYDDTADLQTRAECARCGRRFATDVLPRHEKICSSMKTRKVYNSGAKRISDSEAVNVRKSSPSRMASAAPKKNWKAESEAFRRAMREARQVDKVLKAGGNARDLPPPTYSENSHYIPCPHCNRKFAPDVAERHIPRCASTMNRPKPPPRRR